MNNAANQLGISPDIVAAQIQTESSWDPTVTSPAGAEGIAQFLPSTFNEYGKGSPFNVSDAFNAYGNYMGELLKEEHGNIRDALAAYNAGPENKSAGYSYADGILKLAGTGVTGTAGGTTNAQQAFSLNPLSWPDGIIKFFDTISSGIFWLRVLMVVGGAILALVALNQMTGLAQKVGKAAVKVAKVVK
ncbi:MAG TPA: lytic transglycosylase domain-containing protein [Bryobacteraceae bacterium]